MWKYNHGTGFIALYDTSVVMSVFREPLYINLSQYQVWYGDVFYGKNIKFPMHGEMVMMTRYLSRNIN